MLMNISDRNDPNRRQRTEMLVLVTSVIAVLLLPGQSATYNCSSVYNRIPGNEDLKVICGTALITVDVNLCAVQWAGFDPARLAVNGKYNNSLCRGTIDTQADPPIVRFELAVNHTEENSCWQTMQTSGIQALVVGSYIDMPKSADAVISYSTDLSYHFSCHYPLMYFFNNSQITASSISVGTHEHNGHFFSSLSMGVYNDTSYSYPLIVPEAGLALRTKVFVEVKATNLTGNFHVLLDHCFATPFPYNVLSGEHHSFFTGCQLDKRTVMEKNGMGLSARFFFEVFRFLQHQGRDKSSIYLHCIVRLCEPSKCQVCSRRRRRSQDLFDLPSANSTTVSAGPIHTQNHDERKQPSLLVYSVGGQPEDKLHNPNLVGGVLLGSGGTVLLILGGKFVFKKLSRQENAFRASIWPRQWPCCLAL
ncbi:zona pellucida-like domain-containing protein 1 [Brienomyrus brachyistius]|uniref:zona pellucida-like domain-containing protein 1 n=1 Tax=Brienomyrus brachyistius TaxID=42636 RepID=UPI0020B2A7B8|nr:zona pellucida-like domain-containing protein 1 [Brienomyrus brachyistius]